MNSSARRFDERYRLLRSKGKTGWVEHGGEGWTVHLSCLKKALAHPQSPRAGRALDLGCGAGCWSIELARRGFDVTGIDQSSKAIRWAKQKAADCGFQIDFRRRSVIDCDDLPGATFGFILDGFCFHCLVDAAERNAYFRTAHRLLRDDGVFLLQAFFDDNLQRRISDGTRIDLERRLILDANGIPQRYIGTREDIRRAVEAAEFSILDDYPIAWANGMLMLLATKK